MSPAVGAHGRCIAQGDFHAKLYVTELGTEAHVWTGSANATDADYTSIEFMVEFTGHRKKFGIDVLMTPEKDQVRLINLVRTSATPGSSQKPLTPT